MQRSCLPSCSVNDLLRQLPCWAALLHGSQMAKLLRRCPSARGCATPQRRTRSGRRWPGAPSRAQGRCPPERAATRPALTPPHSPRPLCPARQGRMQCPWTRRPQGHAVLRWRRQGVARGRARRRALLGLPRKRSGLMRANWRPVHPRQRRRRRAAACAVGCACCGASARRRLMLKASMPFSKHASLGRSPIPGEVSRSSQESPPGADAGRREGRAAHAVWH